MGDSIMEWISKKIDAFGTWFVTLVSAAFHALSTWFWDILDGAISHVTGWLAFIVSGLKLPEIFQTPPTEHIPSSIAFLLTQTGFNESMTILLAGITFRMLRKIFSLGQW
jgi:hypothetical protein